jgi:hypothetical protein
MRVNAVEVEDRETSVERREKSAHADFDCRKYLVQCGRIRGKSASSPILTILFGVRLHEPTQKTEEGREDAHDRGKEKMVHHPTPFVFETYSFCIHFQVRREAPESDSVQYL